MYRNKTDEHRNIIKKKKTQIGGEGYAQVEGIDFDEIFAFVARLESFILFL